MFSTQQKKRQAIAQNFEEKEKNINEYGCDAMKRKSLMMIHIERQKTKSKFLYAIQKNIDGK